MIAPATALPSGCRRIATCPALLYAPAGLPFLGGGCDEKYWGAAYMARIASLQGEITTSMDAMAPLVTGGCPQP